MFVSLVLSPRLVLIPPGPLENRETPSFGVCASSAKRFANCSVCNDVYQHAVSCYWMACTQAVDSREADVCGTRERVVDSRTEYRGLPHGSMQPTLQSSFTLADSILRSCDLAVLRPRVVYVVCVLPLQPCPNGPRACDHCALVACSMQNTPHCLMPHLRPPLQRTPMTHRD